MILTQQAIKSSFVPDKERQETRRKKHRKARTGAHLGICRQRSSNKADEEEQSEEEGTPQQGEDDGEEIAMAVHS